MTNETATEPNLSLVKGERGLVLDKVGAPLNDIHIGAGWDVNAPNASTYDLDLFAICVGANGKMVDGGSDAGILKHCAYFNNKNLPGIQCGADNLTGAGDGDDENIHIQLDKIPADVFEVVIGINIYQGKEKGQHMGSVNNAFVRYAPKSDADASVKKYDLTEDYSAFTGIYAFKFYRHETGWKYQAMGEGTNGSIVEMARKFA